MNIFFAGHNLIADPSGALYWPLRQTLIVADLHLEKGSAFARRGQFLPPYDSAETLARLQSRIAHYGAARVLALGDNIHDEGGWARLDHALQAQLASLALDTELVFLYGNHDRMQLPPVGRTLPTLEEEGLRFTHEPDLHDLPTLAGHLHPAASLPTLAGRQRASCFFVGGNILILPAVGV